MEPNSLADESHEAHERRILAYVYAESVDSHATVLAQIRSCPACTDYLRRARATMLSLAQMAATPPGQVIDGAPTFRLQALIDGLEDDDDEDQPAAAAPAVVNLADARRRKRWTVGAIVVAMAASAVLAIISSDRFMGSSDEYAFQPSDAASKEFLADASRRATTVGQSRKGLAANDARDAFDRGWRAGVLADLTLVLQSRKDFTLDDVSADLRRQLATSGRDSSLAGVALCTTEAPETRDACKHGLTAYEMLRTIEAGEMSRFQELAIDSGLGERLLMWLIDQPFGDETKNLARALLRHSNSSAETWRPLVVGLRPRLN